MFYVCIFDPATFEFDVAEHFPVKEDCDKRAHGINSDIIGPRWQWKIYQGEEPFESFVARIQAPVVKDETPEDRQTRLDALALKAGAKTKSKLGEPEIDDVPQWFKDGYASQAQKDEIEAIHAAHKES